MKNSEIFLAFLYFQCCCHRCLVCPQWDISIGQKGKKWTRDAKFRDLTSCLFISPHNPGNSANFTTLHSALIARRAPLQIALCQQITAKYDIFRAAAEKFPPAGVLRHNSRNLWSTNNKVKQDVEIRKSTRSYCIHMNTLKSLYSETAIFVTPEISNFQVFKNLQNYTFLFPSKCFLHCLCSHEDLFCLREIFCTRTLRKRIILLRKSHKHLLLNCTAQQDQDLYMELNLFDNEFENRTT